MRNHWYIVAESAELRASRPLARRLFGQGLVLFRSPQGEAVALPDRCPHRNVPLSGGRLRKGCLQCPYHGWEFDASGQCVYIPSLNPGEKIPPGARLEPLPLREQQGYIWVWQAETPPESHEVPFVIPHFQTPGWGWGRLQIEIPNSVANVIENFIDCAHTGYIHGGLFRTPASHEARTHVQAHTEGVVIDIDEDRDRSSVLSRLLVREQITHQDQFILPSTVQVAYGFGAERQITGWQFCTPQADFSTRVYVHVNWRMGLLNPLITAVFPWVGRLILRQDYRVLAAQAAVIQREGEQFTSVPADTANLWIRACRNRAAKGESPPDERTREVRFRL